MTERERAEAVARAMTASAIDSMERIHARKEAERPWWKKLLDRLRNR